IAYRNLGGRSFAPQVALAAGACGAAFAVGDFDGRMGQDVALVDSCESDVRIYFNDGSGTLLPPEIVSVPAIPWNLAAGDFSGDGVPDLAVLAGTGPSGYELAVLVSTADGAFQPAVERPLAGRPRGLVIADLDHDAVSDV